MKKQVKMISLDTSTSETGYGYYVNGKLKGHGVIKRSKAGTLEDHTNEMMANIYKFIEKKDPQIVVVEMTVVVRNAVTQRELTELIGSVRSQCVVENRDFHRLRPAEWRKLVKDPDEILPRKREELKAWSIQKVKKLFGIDVDDNEADGILIGLAYMKMF